MAKKIALALIAAFAVAGAASAQITVSGGFALSSATVEGFGWSEDSEVGIGGNIYLDYLLPIGVPLSLGAEVGVDTAEWPEGRGTTGIAIPLLLRAAYHFDLHPRLDLYLVGKIGYVIGAVSGGNIEDVKKSGYTVNAMGGIGFGADLGIAFYFSPVVGLFAEAGFDRYNGAYTVSGSENTGGGATINFSDTASVAFNRFLTAGLSFKF